MPQTNNTRQRSQQTTSEAHHSSTRVQVQSTQLFSRQTKHDKITSEANIFTGEKQSYQSKAHKR